jgi:hypothetical protein
MAGNGLCVWNAIHPVRQLLNVSKGILIDFGGTVAWLSQDRPVTDSGDYGWESQVWQADSGFDVMKQEFPLDLRDNDHRCAWRVADVGVKPGSGFLRVVELRDAEGWRATAIEWLYP